MSWLLLAQQASGTADVMTLAASLGTGAVAVLFAMKWVASEAEKRNVMAAEMSRERQAWIDYLKGKRDEDADLIRLMMQKGKAS